MVNGKLLYEDLSYITNQHRIKWLRIIATGIMSHSSVRLPDSTQQLLPRSLVVAVVQSLSRVQLCDLMGSSSQAPLSFTISRSLLRFMVIESVMPSNHRILCPPLIKGSFGETYSHGRGDHFKSVRILCLFSLRPPLLDTHLSSFKG